MIPSFRLFGSRVGRIPPTCKAAGKFFRSGSTLLCSQRRSPLHINAVTNFSSRSAAQFLQSVAPPLDDSRHKGQGGRVGVLGGSVDFAGAPFYTVRRLLLAPLLAWLLRSGFFLCCCVWAGGCCCSETNLLTVHPRVTTSSSPSRPSAPSALEPSFCSCLLQRKPQGQSKRTHRR